MTMNKLAVFLIIFSLLACTSKIEKNKNIPVNKLVINPDLDFRPNIVWIVAEDLSSYLPSFGDSTIVSPNLDKLASQGVCYDNFYSPHPVCAPARAAIITGMYANSIGASHMRTGPWYAGEASKDRLENYSKNYMPEKPLYQDLAYRKQMSIMQELIRLKKAEQLTEKQALWFKDTKPEEELYDLYKDPYEINNLAKDPDYKEKLLELRQVCKEWVENINDTGMQDEKQLISQFWSNNIQPQTADPIISLDQSMVSIQCTTEGASIGYKILSPGTDPSKKSWKVYSKPFKPIKNSNIIAIAHRIGYKRSNEIVQVKNN
ncbi:Sulfatase [hydrothermal vent metagenome]|uniref:Sulfatase n=1 Tax=hydrothermal vent metagenome TaxID=652676 RepID=A0A3B0T9J1_9ZZZZ